MEPTSELSVVFGAMTFGDKDSESARTHSVEDIKEILDVFQKHGHTKVDTARVYTNGTSERLLGDIGWQQRGLVVHTKLYPQPNARHTPEDLRKTLQASLTALRTDKLELFYLHAPDRTTPWEVTFKAVDELHKEGKFDRLGISNYMSWEVAEIVTLCRINGWISPTVYQGIYNAIHRAVEPELFPVLRKYGIAFYAYNPLSGGFLTGRYVDSDSKIEQGSRFDDTKGTSQSVAYRKRYWNDHNFEALSIIAEAAAKENLTVAEVALRWMSHHSLMRREFGDAVIIGASKSAHLEQNLIDLEKGPLPDTIQSAVDVAWRVVAPYVQKYWH
ncbi:hypothetical protein FRC16_010553 [Serendipita sp. 398]|nr:hypothetical protein FRC16_010553 [Serendipita sp. 398]